MLAGKIKDKYLKFKKPVSSRQNGKYYIGNTQN